MLNHLDLFSGIGGFTLGLKAREDIHTLAFAERDPSCRECLIRNFPGIGIYKDCGEVNKTNLPFPVDLITAGFPCQPFSSARHATTTRESHPDYDSFRHILRLSKEFTPRVLLLENVPGLLTLNKGVVINEMLRGLTGIGYNPQIYKLNALDFGLPQHRLRIFIVATREVKLAQEIVSSVQRPTTMLPFLDDEETVPTKYYVKRTDFVPYNPPKRSQKTGIVRIGRWGNINFEYRQRIYGANGTSPVMGSNKLAGGGSSRGSTTDSYFIPHCWAAGEPRYNPTTGIKAIGTWKKIGYAGRKKIYCTSGVSPIILSTPKGGPASNGSKTYAYYRNGFIRTLTGNECRRLMGFPKGFYAGEGRGESTKYGNAVCPPVISAIAGVI